MGWTTWQWSKSAFLNLLHCNFAHPGNHLISQLKDALIFLDNLLHQKYVNLNRF